MNIILKGIGVIIGLFILLAIIGAMFGSHDTSTPAAPTSKTTETKTAFTQDGQNFVSRERMDENVRAGIAKASNYKEVQVPLNIVVLGIDAPDSGVSKQGENPTPAQQIQPLSKTKEPSSTGILNVDSVKQMMPRGEGDDIITVSDGSVYITRKMAENLNAWMTLGSARLDAIDVFQEMFKDSRVNSVKITSTTEFIDKYGRTSQGTGTVYTMTRETYQKINWDNFLTDNLDEVSDYVYIHPAFLK